MVEILTFQQVKKKTSSRSLSYKKFHNRRNDIVTYWLRGSYPPPLLSGPTTKMCVLCLSFLPIIYMNKSV